MKKLNYFTQSLEQRVIYGISKRLCEYLHSHSIRNIFFMDRSARAAWIGMYTYWNLHYKEPRPNIYFINPRSFRRNRSAKEDFTKVFKHIVEQRTMTLAVFDACIHTGKVISPFLETLQSIGFEDVRVLVGCDTNKTSDIETTCLQGKGFRENTCYPFGGYDMVTKEKGILCVGKKERDPVSILIRQEIKTIIRSNMVRFSIALRGALP